MSRTAEALLSDAIPIADSSEDDLEASVREHARLVFRIAHALLRNHHDAEDAVQETFLRLVRHRRKLTAVQNRRAWLARIAWRTALDRVRARGRTASEVPLVAAGTVAGLHAAGAGAEQIAAGQEMLALTECLLAGLPSDLREALTLSSIEELSSAEVGEVLGITETSVRNRVFRARRLLREKMAAVLEAGYER